MVQTARGHKARCVGIAVWIKYIQFFQTLLWIFGSFKSSLGVSDIQTLRFWFILTSSTIDKKLEIYSKLEYELEINKNLEHELEIDENLENFKSNFEFFVNFEFCFEFFVISSFLSMVDELTIT